MMPREDTGHFHEFQFLAVQLGDDLGSPLLVDERELFGEGSFVHGVCAESLNDGGHEGWRLQWRCAAFYLVTSESLRLKMTNVAMHAPAGRMKANVKPATSAPGTTKRAIPPNVRTENPNASKPTQR